MLIQQQKTTPTLESIRDHVRAEWDATHRYLIDTLASTIPLVDQLLTHILQYSGKRIRPLIVLLTARAMYCNTPAMIQLAAAIELIHTATLLHDDVVDNAALRRGYQTAHSIWGNEASVLVGDFFYSKAFQWIVELNVPSIITVFSNATSMIAEGELHQLSNAFNPDITEAMYYHVIECKTAKLLEVAAHTGGLISQAPSSHVTALQEYGRSLGIAYQLIDDALDYSASAEESGKTQGNDLAEGKTTLPLIYAMQRGTAAERAFIRESLQQGHSENLSHILEIIETTQAIEYTANTAKAYAKKACQALQQIPDTAYRQALCDLTQFIVERHF